MIFKREERRAPGKREELKLGSGRKSRDHRLKKFRKKITQVFYPNLLFRPVTLRIK